MPVFDRNKIKNLLQAIHDGQVSPVYLLIGDRYLCQQAADQIVTALCTDNGTVITIDGDDEDSNSTLSRLRSYSLFGGRQIFRVNNSRLFHSKKVTRAIWGRAVKAYQNEQSAKAANYLRAMMEAGGLDSSDPAVNPGGLNVQQWKKCFGFAKPAGNLSWTAEMLAKHEKAATGSASASAAPAGDSGEQLQLVLTAGIPETNILMLVAEEVDKRKKLYKFFKKNYAVIDLSVDTGASSKAKQAQRSVLVEQINLCLREMGKTMESRVIDQLLERVGFYPVAVAMETEKLALYVGERKQITLQDLNTMVGRTRQEAVFELTQAIADRKLINALMIAARLQENGIHSLAVVATLRNFTRSLLLFRALLDQPGYRFQQNMSAQSFQQQCLPLLKENERWKKELSGHPYAVYMKFKTASSFSLSVLQSWLHLLLDADRRLKGSPIAAGTVLEHLIISILKAK